MRPLPFHRHILAHRAAYLTLLCVMVLGGLVEVNGRPQRASYDVKVGDQISLKFGARTVTVEVLAVQETVRQADAGTLYREIGR